MAKTTVYKFKVWDQAIGTYVYPLYRSTEVGIKARSGVIIEGTAKEVDDSELDGQWRYKPDLGGDNAPRS
jgi:hypothetical protein